MAELIIIDLPNSLMSAVRWINDEGQTATYYLPKPLVDIMKQNLTLQDLIDYKARMNPEEHFTV